MARNSIAGSTDGNSKSAKYYQDNIKARLKKNAYNKKYHSTDSRIEYRSSLNKEARKRGVYGTRWASKKDLSHTKTGKMVLESSSKNRARNRGKK